MYKVFALAIMSVCSLMAGCQESQTTERTQKMDQSSVQKSHVTMEYGHAKVEIKGTQPQVSDAVMAVLKDSGYHMYSGGSENAYSSYVSAIMPDQKDLKITFLRGENGSVELLIGSYNSKPRALEQIAKDIVRKIDEKLQN